MSSIKAWGRRLLDRVKGAISSKFFALFGAQDVEDDVKKNKITILQLPIDVVLLITDYLALHDQVTLSETCISFHTVVRLRCGSAALLPKEQRIRYFSAVARSIPDRWACEICAELHPVSFKDAPGIPSSLPCQRTALRPRFHGISIKFKLEHRHVQLALKYQRLACISKNDRAIYLSRLLRPYSAMFRTHPDADRHPCPVFAKYSAHPKLVQQRYLLLSTWEYTAGREMLMKYTMGFLAICRHQWLEFDWHTSEIRCLMAENEYRQKGGIFLNPARNPTKILRLAFDVATESKATAVHASCPLCPVDFAVKYTPDRAIIRAWHDLGPEGTPLDHEWAVHVMQDRPDEPICHVEGSIRDLYESTKRLY
ncbi:hypothetical protein FZEAL_9396 [Fusarium zealandicum]|uniref:F-box domain-containing protein n=1 Tax=Fusarium zealandicum TaxID=1053134 RepID=A0A8H4UBR4_9HYPO|nr:hypothetical protein FZEAL_9396 [Fusarium zealandicum]